MKNNYKLNKVLIDWNNDNMPDDSGILSTNKISNTLDLPLFLRRMKKYGLTEQFWNNWVFNEVDKDEGKSSAQTFVEVIEEIILENTEMWNGLVVEDNATEALSDHLSDIYELVNTVINKYNINFSDEDDYIFVSPNEDMCETLCCTLMGEVLEDVATKINRKEIKAKEILSIGLYYNHDLSLENQGTQIISWEEDEPEIYYIEDIELWSLGNGECFIMEVPNLYYYNADSADSPNFRGEYFYAVMFPKKYKEILEKLPDYIEGNE